VAEDEPRDRPGSFADTGPASDSRRSGYIPGCVGCGLLLLLAALVVLLFVVLMWVQSSLFLPFSAGEAVLALFVAALLAIWGIWFLVNARERRP